MAYFIYDALLPLGKSEKEQAEEQAEDEQQLSSILFRNWPLELDSDRTSTVLRREIHDDVQTSNDLAVVQLKQKKQDDQENDDYLSIVEVKKTDDEAVAVVVHDTAINNESIRVPWKTNISVQSPLLFLHQEIVNFCEFLSPTSEEKELRGAAVERVTTAIKKLWSACDVKVFGSYETGLYLPTSDIDLVVLNSNVGVPQKGLKDVAKILNREGIGKNIQVIGKAKVPIVKFIETKSNMAFDVSFDAQNGPKAAMFIKDAVSKIPPLKPLCLVLKIFLQQRELNEVYSGGVGSYALLVMLMSHLQMHWSRDNFMDSSTRVLEHNLGILLIDFFNLYGRKLNWGTVGISCRSGGHFFRKNSRRFFNAKRPDLLAVEDPQSPENDIGKNSYNIGKVRKAFFSAYRLLKGIEHLDGTSPCPSILGQIIRLDEKLLNRRPADLPDSSTWQVKRWEFCDDEPLPRGGRSRQNVLELQNSNRKRKRNSVESSPVVTWQSKRPKRKQKSEKRNMAGNVEHNNNNNNINGIGKFKRKDKSQQSYSGKSKNKRDRHADWDDNSMSRKKRKFR